MPRPRRLLPTGLRWRLAGWVAAVVLISSAVTFAAVYRGTGTQLRNQINDELASDLGEFSQVVRSIDSRKPAEVAAAAGRYVRNQPFSTGSTLQFATVQAPGRKTETVTNRPELFGASSPDKSESLAEQGRENLRSLKLLSAPAGYSTLSLPDIGSLRLVKRQLPSRHGTQVTLGVGERLAGVSNAQRGVAEAFILAGILALVGALAASYAIGTRFSRPLRRMASVAARVDAGDLHPRIHKVGSRSDEMQVLADSFDHMLDRLTDAFASQRAFVADASHELRTPLTAIRGQLEVLAGQPDPSSEEVRRVERLVQAEIARIARLVDDLLLLAQAEQAEFLRPETIELEPYVGELWDGISLLTPRRFELGAVPVGTLRADPDRLAQALRNLLTNAIAHTAPRDGLVRLDVDRDGPERDRDGPERLRFVVSDDGPGIPLDQRERVFDRFHRTGAARDRASGGTGLGLAIVRAIAVAHGGTVTARDRPAGETGGGVRHRRTVESRGVSIELELPGFTPGRRRPSQTDDPLGRCPDPDKRGHGAPDAGSSQAWTPI